MNGGSKLMGIATKNWLVNQVTSNNLIGFIPVSGRGHPWISEGDNAHTHTFSAYLIV
jgi:hypothetical protein